MKTFKAQIRPNKQKKTLKVRNWPKLLQGIQILCSVLSGQDNTLGSYWCLSGNRT